MLEIGFWWWKLGVLMMIDHGEWWWLKVNEVWWGFVAANDACQLSMLDDACQFWAAPIEWWSMMVSAIVFNCCLWWMIVDTSQHWPVTVYRANISWIISIYRGEQEGWPILKSSSTHQIANHKVYELNNSELLMHRKSSHKCVHHSRISLGTGFPHVAGPANCSWDGSQGLFQCREEAWVAPREAKTIHYAGHSRPMMSHVCEKQCLWVNRDTPWGWNASEILEPRKRL